MFDGILSNAGSSGPIFIILALIAYLVVCSVHFYRWGRFRRTRSLVQYSFWLFFLMIAVLILLPLPDITPDFCRVYEDAGELGLTPFDFVYDIARHSGYTRQRFSIQALFRSQPFVLAVSNILAFVPLGIYLRLFTRRSIFACILIPFGCSLAFEVTQGTGIFGLYPCPYRHFNVDDLMLNTLGAVLGMLAVTTRNAYIFRFTRP